MNQTNVDLAELKAEIKKSDRNWTNVDVAELKAEIKKGDRFRTNLIQLKILYLKVNAE